MASNQVSDSVTAVFLFAELKIYALLQVDEVEGVSKFLNDATAQWRNLALEVRSVRSMLEEVISNWEKYTSSVAALQAWLEDAERMLSQSENAKRVSTNTSQEDAILFALNTFMVN